MDAVRYVIFDNIIGVMLQSKDYWNRVANFVQQKKKI